MGTICTKEPHENCTYDYYVGLLTIDKNLYKGGDKHGYEMLI